MEGGGLVGSLTQARHTLPGSSDLGRGSFLSWAPGEEAQKDLLTAYDSVALTLPAPLVCCSGQCPAPPGLTQDAGAEARGQSSSASSVLCYPVRLCPLWASVN